MKRRLFLPLAIFALFAAGCASEGLPSSYSDQDGRAETQFVAACEESLVGTEVDDPASHCRCAFFTIASQFTFAEFIELDEKLKDDPGAFTLEERQLLEGVSLPCAVTEADINRTVSEN